MNFLKRHPITLYFALAFFFSWIIRTPLDILNIHFLLLTLLSEFAPMVAALIVTCLIYGKGAGLELLARVKSWRVNLWWYVVVLVEPLIVQLLVNGVYMLLGGQIQSQISISLIGHIVLGLLIVGPGEEIGWRGFAQPELQKRTSILTTSLLIGLLWGIWHYEPFIAGTTLGVYTQPIFYVPFIWFVAQTCVFSLFMSWVYNRSGGSVFLMILMHLSLTFYGGLGITTTQSVFIRPEYMVTIAQAVILLVGFIWVQMRRRQAVAASKA